jgi:hypothetical protein
MMKRLLLVLLCALPLHASTATVTATVTDADSQAWVYGKWTATLSLPSGQFGNVTPSIGGVNLTPSQINVSGVLDGSGVLSTMLTDTSSLDQAGAQWSVKVCPFASVPDQISSGCYIVKRSIVGASLDLTPSFTGIPAPRFPAGANQYGYSDAEVLPTAVCGITYYNVTTGLRVWDCIRNQWGGISGGGSMVYPAAGIAVSTGSAWNSSKTAPSGAVVGTTDTQTLTSKTVDGVTPTTFGYLDPTSSVQTQLNAKQGTITLTTTGTSGASTLIANTLNIPQYVGGVSSVTNSDGSATVSPTSGAVVVSVNTAHANTWTGTQTFSGSGAPFTFTTIAIGSLPSASTAGDGATYMVNDSNTLTAGTCTAGGANRMLAVSNGTTWTCH